MILDKNRQQLIILGVVVAIFIVATAATVLKPRAKRPAGGKYSGGAKRPAATKAGAPEAAPGPSPQKERIVSSFKTWGRDPFVVGAGVAPEASGSGALTGIFCDPKMSYCIIDGKVAKVGEEVSGYKILEISNESVTVKIGNETKVLKVGR